MPVARSLPTKNGVPRTPSCINGEWRGARAITAGGLMSLPKLVFPGGALVGDDAGFLNASRIKGSHGAIKTGMLAAGAAGAAFDATLLRQRGASPTRCRNRLTQAARGGYDFTA